MTSREGDDKKRRPVGIFDDHRQARIVVAAGVLEFAHAAFAIAKRRGVVRQQRSVRVFKFMIGAFDNLRA